MMDCVADVPRLAVGFDLADQYMWLPGEAKSVDEINTPILARRFELDLHIIDRGNFVQDRAKHLCGAEFEVLN